MMMSKETDSEKNGDISTFSISPRPLNSTDERAQYFLKKVNLPTFEQCKKRRKFAAGDPLT